MNEDKPAARGERRDKVADEAEEKLGTHPLGSTAGAVGGAVAGAVTGLAAGPVGSVAGAVGGAVLGAGLGASSTGGTAPVVDTSPHEAWWREHYASRPYVPAGAAYDDYEPAYRYGIERYMQTDRPREWNEVEDEMADGWPAAKGRSRLGWEEAKHAVRDAWERMREPQA